MFNIIKKYRREFVYSSYLFLIFELLATPSFAVNLYYFLGISLMGYVLINLWLISTYKLHSSRKVSKYSDVLLKVNLVERLFSYVVLPLLFYSSVVAFIILSLSTYMTQVVIVVSIFLIFYLFLYVRTSYEKVYSINRATRFSMDFISIVSYFIFTSVISRLVQDTAYNSLIVFFVTLFFLIYVLYHHNKFDIQGIIIAFIISLIITAVSIFINTGNLYTDSLLMSILYYLVVSLWNVRFSGSRVFSDYIPPLMYSIMAVILILSL